MKKKFLAIFLLVFSILSLGFIAAWSYDNSYSYGDASAYVIVIGSYPKCDGISYEGGAYCVGDYIIDYTIMGDYNPYSANAYVIKQLGYSFTSWSQTGDDSKNGYPNVPTASCPYKNNNGECSGNDVALPVKNGHPKGYILCATHYDEAQNGDWAWASKCGGYTIDVFSELNVVDCYKDSDCGSNKYCDKSGSSVNWECKQKICNDGEEQCSGTLLQRCSNNAWQNIGTTIGKCGVECTSGSKCDGINYLVCENNVYVNNGEVIGQCDVECIGQSNKCEGSNYILCENNVYVDKGIVSGKCGIQCINGENKCEGTSYLVCENNAFVNKGEVVGKCGVEKKVKTKLITWIAISLIIIFIIIILYFILRKSKRRK